MSADAFFTLYRELPRYGPGSDACTREALRRPPALPPSPRVVDLGCGAGRRTRVLAEALRSRVLAVDLHAPFLDTLVREARARGLDAYVEPRCQDMGALDGPPAYPSMGTVPANRATAGAGGDEVLDTSTLPASACWDDDYTPPHRGRRPARGHLRGGGGGRPLPPAWRQPRLRLLPAAPPGPVKARMWCAEAARRTAPTMTGPKRITGMQFFPN